MTYSESARGVRIGIGRAISEVIAHGADVGEFIDEVGEHDTYMASDVLAWLGY